MKKGYPNHPYRVTTNLKQLVKTASAAFGDKVLFRDAEFLCQPLDRYALVKVLAYILDCFLNIGRVVVDVSLLEAGELLARGFRQYACNEIQKYRIRMDARVIGICGAVRILCAEIIA